MATLIMNYKWFDLTWREERNRIYDTEKTESQELKQGEWRTMFDAMIENSLVNFLEKSGQNVCKITDD